MTNEERKKYFKCYAGEERCPEQWRGKAEGVIWGGERVAEENWEKIKSGEWDKGLGIAPRPIEDTIEDIVISVAQKFDPWDWEEIAERYASLKES